MKKLVLVLLLVVMACSYASAHDGDYYFTFTGVGSSFTLEAEHEDEAPWKGNATIWITNNSDEPWSDLHLSLFAVQQPFGVVFKDASMGGQDPTSSQSGLSWTISPDQKSMELVFTQWVGVGQTAWFKVYTDNTATQKKYGLSVYPTSDYVPEPSSIIAMLGGLAGFGGYAIRRRK